MKPIAPMLLAAFAAASSIQAAPRVVEYDLRGRSDSLGEVHVGSGAELRVTRMNPVRYIYRAKTGTTAIDPLSFTDVFAFLPVTLGALQTITPSVLTDDVGAAATALQETQDRLTAAQALTMTRQKELALREDQLTVTKGSTSTTAGTDEVVRLQKQIAELRQQITELLAQLIEIQVKLAAAQKRLAEAEARLKAADDVDKRFKQIGADLKALTEAVNAHSAAAKRSTSALTTAEKSLRQLYIDSNDLEEVDLLVAARAWVGVVNAVPAWPSASTDDMSATADQLRGELLALKHRPDASDFTLWAALEQNAEAYLAAREGVDELTTALDAAADNKTKFATGKAKLDTEGLRLQTLSRDIAVKTYNIACADQPNRTEWTLTIQDRLPKDSGGEDAREVTVATFVCANWATISSGVLFNGLEERVYEFQPSLVQGDDGNASENIVGLASESSFQPTLGLLANFRFAQLSPAWSLHGSVGASIDLGGEDAGDAGFLAGPSLGFRDLLYITVGPLVGRTESLTPGFSVGNPQPMGVTEVPTTKTWNVTWGIGLTFKIK